jgi:hypothetical protein
VVWRPMVGRWGKKGNKMSSPKFRDSRGRLTAYSFACGYIEESVVGGVRVILSKDGCWHVEGREDDTGFRLFWETFGTMAKARLWYDRKCRQLARGDARARAGR